MADNHAEQIMVAFQALVTGLATTETRVHRGRRTPIAVMSSTPTLLVYMAANRPVPDLDLSWDVLDCYLELVVVGMVHTGSQVDTVLNTIDKETQIAVLGTPQLGLAFVTDTVWMGNEEPDLGELEQQTAQMPMIYRVQYSRSQADPSQ